MLSPEGIPVFVPNDPSEAAAEAEASTAAEDPDEVGYGGITDPNEVEISEGHQKMKMNLSYLKRLKKN